MSATPSQRKSLGNGDLVLHPTLQRCGKRLPPDTFQQKPVYAGKVQVSKLDDNPTKKVYYAVVATKLNKTTGKFSGTLFLLREGKNTGKKHHRTLFPLGEDVSIRYNKNTGGEAEIELSWGKGVQFCVTSLSSGEKYYIPGNLVLYPESSPPAKENGFDPKPEFYDVNLKALFRALTELAGGYPCFSKYKIEKSVTEEAFLREIGVFLNQLQGALELKFPGKALDNFFKSVLEALTTEIKYLYSYVPYQTSMKQLEILLSSLETGELSNFTNKFDLIMKKVDPASNKAMETFEHLYQFLHDTMLIVDDEARQVVKICNMLSRAAERMQAVELDLLLISAPTFALLKELGEFPSFQTFNASLELGNDQNKRLIDFVGSAFQRVTRRPLVLQSCYKNLLDAGCFRSDLMEEVAYLEQELTAKASEINEQVKSSELVMSVIAQQLKPAVYVDEPERICLLRTKVNCTSMRKVGINQFVLVLFVFNDCLLFAKEMDNSEQQLIFHSVYGLRNKTGEILKYNIDVEARTLKIVQNGKSEEFELGTEASKVKEEVEKCLLLPLCDRRLPSKEQRLSATLLSKIGVRSSAQRRASPLTTGRSTPSTSVSDDSRPRLLSAKSSSEGPFSSFRSTPRLLAQSTSTRAASPLHKNVEREQIPAASNLNYSRDGGSTAQSMTKPKFTAVPSPRISSEKSLRPASPQVNRERQNQLLQTPQRSGSPSIASRALSSKTNAVGPSRSTPTTKIDSISTRQVATPSFSNTRIISSGKQQENLLPSMNNN